MSSGVRVLWIGAHPDDELFVAPYLGKLYEEGATCGFVVATRGERGPCYREEGCEPDLATVREEEMRCAAAIFGGSVEFAGLYDTFGDDWGASEAETIRPLIERFAPDLILTFDPRNGCTNHEDHRGVGRLVQHLGLPIPTKLVESRLSWRGPLEIAPAVPEATPFDATDWWDFLLRDLACHRSQMRPETIDLFRNAAADQKRVWFLG
jgi:LmbE family N-acetylglucosaminyl deacetylase